MATPSVIVTVEELERLAGDGAYDQCGGRLHVEVRGLRPFTRACRRRAVAVITVTCSRDGSYTRGICGRHLRAVRVFPGIVTCSDCGQPAAWTVGG